MRLNRAIAVRVGWGTVLGATTGLLGLQLRLPEIVSYHHARAPLLLGALLSGGLLGALRLRGILWSALGVLGLLWLVVAFTPLDRMLAEGLPREDPLTPADAVYVLASDVQRDGDLSTEAITRLLHGLALVQQGLAPRLILAELPRPHDHHAEAARRLMAELGLSTELLVVGPVTNTHDEAVQVAELCREHGLGRLLVVTSRLHSRRAAETFERQGLVVISSPSREHKYDLERLDAPDDRVRAFPDIVHERLGHWVYERRDWLRTEEPR